MAAATPGDATPPAPLPLSVRWKSEVEWVSRHHLSSDIALKAPLEPAPRTAVILNQRFGFRWAPATGRIERERTLFFVSVPFFLDLVDKPPGFLHLISSGKKGRISSHRIQQQPFIRFRTRCPKRCAVM